MLLYGELLRGVDQSSVTEKDLIDTSAIFSTILYKVDIRTSEQISEILYALILHHHKSSGRGKNAKTIPYGGKKDRKNSIVFHVCNFDPLLQKIFILFVRRLIEGSESSI